MRHLLPLLFLCTLTLHALSDYRPAEGYVIKFTTGGAEGTFSDLEGTIRFEPDDLARSKFEVSVVTATIQTGNETKDKHARGESWLHAEKYPHISFVSDRFSRGEAGGYIVSGTLTIRGKSQPVSIPFTFTEIDGGPVFEGSLTVDRKNYGIDGPFLVNAAVGREIEVTLRVPVQRE